jgi:hypothetical protein
VTRVFGGTARHEKKRVEHAKIVWQDAARSLCSARDSHRLLRDSPKVTARNGRAGTAAARPSAQRLEDTRSPAGGDDKSLG